MLFSKLIICSVYKPEHLFYIIVKYEDNVMKPVPVDLICAHLRDGSISPIRIRVIDEDGQRQTYSIKEYRELSHQGARIMPDGVYVTNNTLIFECKIEVFGNSKTIRLYNTPPSLDWHYTH